MKIQSKKGSVAGVAMTEYLILLALVAIASLVMTIAFGKQVKTAFAGAIDGMGGRNATKKVVATPNVDPSTMENFGASAGN